MPRKPDARFDRPSRFFRAVVRIVALSLLVFAIARPQKGTEQIREVSEGIAIEMVVDRSSSMGAEMSFRNRRLNRLEVVKDVFEDFVLGDSRGLGGRENDLIGMISFARYPETICPLTLGHGALPKFLDNRPARPTANGGRRHRDWRRDRPSSC